MLYLPKKGEIRRIGFKNSLLFRMGKEGIQVEGGVVDVIYLHCSKYPHLQVFGVLLGRKDEVNAITRAIPLFHGPFLAPMFESAMRLVDAYCETSSLTIKGAYYANELLSQTEVPSAVASAAKKIHSLYSNSILFAVNNNQIHPSTSDRLLQLRTLSKSGDWTADNQSVIQDTSLTTSERLRELLSTRTQDCLIDFDDHLDQPTKSFLTQQWIK